MMISGSKYLRSKRDPISIIPTTFEAYIYSGNKEHKHQWQTGSVGFSAHT